MYLKQLLSFSFTQKTKRGHLAIIYAINFSYDNDKIKVMGWDADD